MLIIALIWCILIPLAIGPVLGWSHFEFDSGNCLCSRDFRGSISYSIVLVLVTVLIPLFVMCLCYYQILSKWDITPINNKQYRKAFKDIFRNSVGFGYFGNDPVLADNRLSVVTTRHEDGLGTGRDTDVDPVSKKYNTSISASVEMQEVLNYCCCCCFFFMIRLTTRASWQNTSHKSVTILIKTFNRLHLLDLCDGNSRNSKEIWVLVKRVEPLIFRWGLILYSALMN